MPCLLKADLSLDDEVLAFPVLEQAVVLQSADDVVATYPRVLAQL